MGFSWQQNITVDGLRSAGVTAAARWLDFPQFTVTNGPHDTGLGKALWYVPPDMDVAYTQFALHPPAEYPHFPYGMEVEPNVPV